MFVKKIFIRKNHIFIKMLASFFAFVLNQISPYFSKIVYIAYMLNVLFIIITLMFGAKKAPSIIFDKTIFPLIYQHKIDQNQNCTKIYIQFTHTHTHLVFKVCKK